VTDSFGTPTGLHLIVDKVGEGEPLGTVFRHRLSLGKKYWELEPEEQTKNLITTRILRLRGLEEGFNSGPGHDSYDRLIYIHGTNHEDKIGTPNSAGCIEMLNDEVLDLFNQVPSGTLVLIEE
jgi:lipoprotein-anchoring transpeptidase ErfK/SrfK